MAWNKQPPPKKTSYNCIVVNTSAIQQEAAHTTYHLLDTQQEHTPKSNS